MEITRELRRWYLRNKRDLPWRHTRDPYLIWLSEVILQQTRVDQGLKYYLSFASAYPKITDLANAPEDEVLKRWQGLGYYSRARNLHATAKQIATAWGGHFPSTYEDLLTLKGIGQYTAAAIASFAFNLPEPVVDGNVYRVLARLFGDNTPIDSTIGKKQFREFAAQLLDHTDPATHNQAIMEFGALQCTPKSPQCGTCPFVQICIAYRQNRVAELPLKAKKTTVTERFFHYFVFRFKRHIYVKQRTENDIWKNLYDFPLIETDGERQDPFLSQQWKLWMKGTTFSVQSVSDEWKHLLSHQRLHVYFYEIVLQKAIPVQHNFGWLKVDEQEFQKLAVPIIIHNYMHKRQKTA